MTTNPWNIEPDMTAEIEELERMKPQEQSEHKPTGQEIFRKALNEALELRCKLEKYLTPPQIVRVFVGAAAGVINTTCCDKHALQETLLAIGFLSEVVREGFDDEEEEPKRMHG